MVRESAYNKIMLRTKNNPIKQKQNSPGGKGAFSPKSLADLLPPGGFYNEGLASLGGRDEG